MILAFYVSVLFVWLLITQEVFRRFPRFTFAVFTILSILLVPYWTEKGTIKDWFNWVKVFSVIFPLIWFSIFRLTSIGETKFAKWVIYLLLLANILEAVVKDSLSGGAAHYFNAMAGILLIATLNKIDSISTSKDKYLDVNWNGMTLAWIIGYTIWNWTFVYLNLINVAALHIAVLGASLVIAFINKGRWLQVRTLTLGTFLFFYFTLSNKLDQRIYSSGFWANESFGYIIAGVSLAFMTVYSIIFVRSKLQTSRQE
jgi:hypothetical protein